MTLTKASVRAKVKTCKDCNVTRQFHWAKNDGGKFVLIEHVAATSTAKGVARGAVIADTWLHVCGVTPNGLIGSDDDDSPKGEVPPAPYGTESEEDQARRDADPVPSPANSDVPAPLPAGMTPEQKAALEALGTIFGGSKQEIDRDEIVKIAREVVGSVVFPTKTVVIRDGNETEVQGTSHYQLASVIRASRRRNVMLVGPAGSGKSHIASQVAEAFNLPFYNLSLTSQTPVSAINGYMNATGDYVRTAFREAYEHGGVFCLDETDNGHPNTLGAINSAIANGVHAFADGMVKRHNDFRIIATANTYGRGATRAYVGRNQLDAAFLNRFVKRTIQYDAALELSMCHATGVSNETVVKVLDYIARVRKNADANGIQVIVSPRQSEAMCDLIAEGDTFDEAIDAAVRDGLADDVWSKLTA